MAHHIPDSFPNFNEFSDAVRSWFLETFQAPTALQEQAWGAIKKREHVLAIAPTGSGKTLAAFLFALDTLMRERADEACGGCSNAHEGNSPKEGVEGKKKDHSSSSGTAVQPDYKQSKQATKATKATKGVRVLYLSPLKALGADVQRNLQEPLAGIAQRAAAQGIEVPTIRTGMRTGDTPADQRRALVRNPPDILITTPESLYLLLTSQAREILRRVETVIVDEVHALAGDKRGAHLAVSLERLDCLLEHPAQRIGLSATVRPRSEIARFLGGVHPVSVVAAEAHPNLDIKVVVPVADMTAIPLYGGPATPDQGVAAGVASTRRPRQNEAWKSDRALRAVMDKSSLPKTPDSRTGSSSIWPYIEASLLDEVLAHRSTIVFVNSRGLCEKLTARLNELYAKRTGSFDRGEGEAADGIPSHYRSDMGSSTELVVAVTDVIAKAHHGSVSKEKRLQVEHELKTGQLPCVVATSSLELGIDMGSIDLVLQVAAPPSVASGLQRIGRANHQVGGRSEGAIYPRMRTEIIDAVVTAEGMRQGSIEHTSLVCNPLDVLAQQTVAAVAMGELAGDEWFATVRRAAPYSQLKRSVFDAVLDMLAGRYASGDLTEFAPRIIWDREHGTLKPRAGTQRQAVTAAGTIPDRGMFSVVLPESDENAGRRRVGELDEEMVYESRVGDIIALGTNSWRISEITQDRVIVQPAPGRSARLPFWHGEGVGRPAETGYARGEFLRAMVAGMQQPQEGEEGERGLGNISNALRDRLAKAGLDKGAQNNLLELIGAQRAATGTVPHDKVLVVERCEDEQGDWRVILHSPFGRRVHEPWAMAVAQRVAQLHGYNAQAMAADNGIVLRIPQAETRLPGAELFVFDPEELERMVRERVGTTPLFAARFRECAARALLMSPTTPGKRAPLWQQRLKAGQLLEAARSQRDFPLLLETTRECLQDVFDLKALRQLMEEVQVGTVSVVEAQTSIPSPFAAAMLFGYVAEHLYEGDLPHAEKRASLLSLDPALLGELLGSTDMAEVLDEQVVEKVEAELQHLASHRRVQGVEGVADLLRGLGPLSEGEVAQRLREGQQSQAAALLAELQQVHRAFSVAIGGVERWVFADDALRLHSVLGIPLPSWLPAAHGTRDGQACGDDARDGQACGGQPHAPDTLSTPLDGLVLRHAATHGFFSAEEVARRLGLGVSLVWESLDRLLAAGKLMRGHYGTDTGNSERAWVCPKVYNRLRSLSLAKARREVQPVPHQAFVRYLFSLQGVGAPGEQRFDGVEGVAQVLAQFEGVFLPAALWESSVLPARVRNYRPAMLDELLASGEVVWVGNCAQSAAEPGEKRHGSKGADPVKEIAFYPTDSPFAPQQPHPSDSPFTSTESSQEDRGIFEAVVEVLSGGGGLFLRQIVDAVRCQSALVQADEASVAGVLTTLAWRGQATNDTFAAVRASGTRNATTKPRPPSRRRASSRHAQVRYVDAQARGRAREGAAAFLAAQNTLGAIANGRWSLMVPSSENYTVRTIALVESLLFRYGVISRDVALLSGIAGGLGSLMPILRSMEDAGEVLRGAFVEGMGPAQFATRETVDVLRTYVSMPAQEEQQGAEVRKESDTPKGCDLAESTKGNRTTGNCEEDASCIPNRYPFPQRSNTSPVQKHEAVALAADDPACLFGAALPWPAALCSHAESLEPSVSLRPSRRTGSVVVLRAGEPVLYAPPGLRALLAFTSNVSDLIEAAQVLAAYTTESLKREGGDASRKKIVVTWFNGQPVLDTFFADVLQQAGFVRLPDGMRLYVSPF